MSARDTAPRPVTASFYWKGGRRGCLLSHGLTGTPYEMRFVGEQLHRAGFTVSGVALAGHVGRVEELARCRWQDWYASLERGVEQLRRDCDRVMVGGLSLGSLLALRLAHQRPDCVDAIALLSTPLVLGNRWARRVPLSAHRALRFLPTRLSALPKRSEIADPAALAIHPGNTSMPLSAVAELLKLARLLRVELSEVRQPALVIQAQDDPTAPMVNLEILSAALPNLFKAVRLTRSRHVITVDYEKQQVADEMVRFAQAVLRS